MNFEFYNPTHLILGAADIELAAGELQGLNAALDEIEISGDRYPAELARRVDK